MGEVAALTREAGDSHFDPANSKALSGGPADYEDIEIDLGADFRLESGDLLQAPIFRMRLYGPQGAPVVAVGGGISADRKVADSDDGPGWWRRVAARGGPLDTDRFRILGFDFLPDGAERLVTITPHDQARAVAAGLDAIGIDQLHSFVGASYGGVVALAFAALFPERIDRLCVISAAARPDPMATALRGVQRRIIALAREAGRDREGVSLARQLAMTTYRTAEEFRARFNSAPLGAQAGDAYDVCAYLQARGEAYAALTPPERYLALSDSLDRADVDAARISADCLFIASLRDRLAPIEDIERTARMVSGRSCCFAIDGITGHDAFLCETEKFAPRLKSFIERS